jgi:hypothetical protein
MTTPAISIRHRLTRLLFLSSGAVLALTTIAFCTYEAVTFRHSSIQQLQTLSQAIASNSTAALAFDNTEDATSVLGAFRAEPHIVGAALYDSHGRLFATYPQTAAASSFPTHPGMAGFAFTRSALAGFMPVVEGTSHLGMLYVQSDLGAMYARIELYALIVVLVIGLCSALAYLDGCSMSSFVQYGPWQRPLERYRSATTIACARIGRERRNSIFSRTRSTRC